MKKTMGRRALIFAILLLNLAWAVGSLAAGDVGTDEIWTLVWSDEFEGDTLDLNKWRFQLGTGTEYGLTDWGNNEQQYYRAENSRVENGLLIIEPRPESFGGKSYTSSRLFTKDTYAKKYGKIEAKIKLPAGQGFWPAFWMMPKDDVYGDWAASGEIDIMEANGKLPTKIEGTIHFGGSWPLHTHSGGSYDFPDGQDITDFHVYAVEWEPGEIRWYVDGVLYSVKNDWYTVGSGQTTPHPFPAPFDQEFYLLLNVAIGGHYVGNEVPPAEAFPASMQVDYVRVYELTGRPYRTVDGL